MIIALEVEDGGRVFHWHLLVTFACPAFRSVAFYCIVLGAFGRFQGKLRVAKLWTGSQTGELVRTIMIMKDNVFYS